MSDKENILYYQNIQRKISKEDWDNYVLERTGHDRDIKIPYHHSHFEQFHQWDFNIGDDPHYCKHFGCGQILTYKEQLYGDYCIIHNMMGETCHKKIAWLRSNVKT